MALTWWCTECWSELAGPRERCACGFDPATDQRDYVERLTATLRHPMADRAMHAAVILGQIGDPRAVEPLCAALDSDDPYLQAEAAKALGRIGSPAAEPHLLRLLDEGMLPGRVMAARVLSGLGGTATRRALVARAREGSRQAG